MLTRLKVSGFKNLVDVDVRFGPFTCVAGANGVGKSNLFDAIRFLGALADDTFTQAAAAVRDRGGRPSDLKRLFHHVRDQHDREMSFDAEMIIPPSGTDDLGQEAEAAITLVRYGLTLRYREDSPHSAVGGLELIRESLDRINIGDVGDQLGFPHQLKWRRTVATGRRSSPFISTKTGTDGEVVIHLHQDGKRGRPKQLLARNLPKTVLSSVNALEHPTALLTRREMQSWRLLQLEPSALREPDRFDTPPGIQSSGAHLPATLYHLARSAASDGNDGVRRDSWVYEQVAGRLADLIDDIDEVYIDKDDRRELLTLMARDLNGTAHPAKALSDGTLRFLALSVLALDDRATGLICLEEPENGIHPRRIPSMIQLLEDIAVDPDEPMGPDNPLRQVIVNTHSPRVVQQVPADSLLVAELREMVRDDLRFKRLAFGWLKGTWRSSESSDRRNLSMGTLLAYLAPGDDAIDPDAPPTSEPRRRGQGSIRAIAAFKALEKNWT